MLFQPKVETIAWKDFFDQREAVKQAAPALLASIPMLSLVNPFPTNAHHQVLATTGIQERVIHAFQPIIDLVQGAAYPITFLWISAGFIVIIMGKRPTGMAMIKWAAIGFVGLQFAPVIMQLLVEVGKAMHQ